MDERTEQLARQLRDEIRKYTAERVAARKVVRLAQDALSNEREIPLRDRNPVFNWLFNGDESVYRKIRPHRQARREGRRRVRFCTRQINSRTRKISKVLPELLPGDAQ